MRHRTGQQVFGAETADLRPLSGHIADLIVLASFTKPNDTIMCISTEDGGYPGTWKKGIQSLLRLKAMGFPFIKENTNIDVNKAEKVMRDKQPRMVIFGASLFLFPHPVKALAKDSVCKLA